MKDTWRYFIAGLIAVVTYMIIIPWNDLGFATGALLLATPIPFVFGAVYLFILCALQKRIYPNVFFYIIFPFLLLGTFVYLIDIELTADSYYIAENLTYVDKMINFFKELLLPIFLFSFGIAFLVPLEKENKSKKLLKYNLLGVSFLFLVFISLIAIVYNSRSIKQEPLPNQYKNYLDFSELRPKKYEIDSSIRKASYLYWNDKNKKLFALNSEELIESDEKIRVIDNNGVVVHEFILKSDDNYFRFKNGYFVLSDQGDYFYNTYFTNDTIKQYYTNINKDLKWDSLRVKREFIALAKKAELVTLDDLMINDSVINDLKHEKTTICFIVNGKGIKLHSKALKDEFYNEIAEKQNKKNATIKTLRPQDLDNDKNSIKVGLKQNYFYIDGVNRSSDGPDYSGIAYLQLSLPNEQLFFKRFFGKKIYENRDLFYHFQCYSHPDWKFIILKDIREGNYIIRLK